MIRDNLIALVAQRIGNRTDLTSRMITELLLLQETKLEQNSWLPWFLETEMEQAALTVGEERLALPSDFLEEIEDQALWLYDTAAEVKMASLSKMGYDAMLAKYPGDGRPAAYSIGNQYFHLRPVADAAYIIKTRYMAKDALLDTNIENKWLKYASDLVIAELGAVMARHVQNGNLVALYEADAEKAWSRLYAKHVAREEINGSRVMEA